MSKVQVTILFLMLCTICVQAADAKDTVELSIHLLTHESIIEANVESEVLMSWSKQFVDIAEGIAGKEKDAMDIAIQAVVHKDSDVTITVSTKPKCLQEKLDAYKTELEKISVPHSRFCDYSILFVLKVNGGCRNEKLDFIPPVVRVDEQIYLDYTSSSLEKKKIAMQNWAKNEVLPVIGHYASLAETHFEGVVAVGKAIQSKDYLESSNISDLTDKNSQYWRAVLEMGGGNELIPAGKVFMHVANGEFDIARRYLQIIRYFCDEQALATYFLSELNWRLEAFYDSLEKEIQLGIKLHDGKEYEKAVEHYKQLLLIYPKSAWANYELFYSENALNGFSKDEYEKNWSHYKEKVYSCDPLYPVNVHANSGKQGYLFLRRMEIKSLFQDEKAIKKDLVRYADIALDLEEYGFAAQLYWYIFTSFQEEDYQNRNILAHFLYCLDKLGIEGIAQNFKGDFKQEFKKIEEERKSIMEDSAAFKAFEKKS